MILRIVVVGLPKEGNKNRLNGTTLASSIELIPSCSFFRVTIFLFCSGRKQGRLPSCANPPVLFWGRARKCTKTVLEGKERQCRSCCRIKKGKRGDTRSQKKCCSTNKWRGHLPRSCVHFNGPQYGGRKGAIGHRQKMREKKGLLGGASLASWSLFSVARVLCFFVFGMRVPDKGEKWRFDQFSAHFFPVGALGFFALRHARRRPRWAVCAYLRGCPSFFPPKGWSVRPRKGQPIIEKKDTYSARKKNKKDRTRQICAAYRPNAGHPTARQTGIRGRTQLHVPVAFCIINRRRVHASGIIVLRARPTACSDNGSTTP